MAESSFELDIKAKSAAPSTPPCCNLKCCGLCCFAYWVLTAILFGLLVASAHPASRDFNVLHRIKSDTVFGHRGSKNLWPESTLFTFANALSMGMDAIECDLRRTKDGRIVLLHDEHTTRTTQRDSRVQDLTLSEVKLLDAGWWWGTGSRDARGKDQKIQVPWSTYPFRSLGLKIPTLVEVFVAFPNVTKLIELKTEQSTNDDDDAEASVQSSVGGVPMVVLTKTCELIKAHNQTDRVIVASFSEQALVEFRSICPSIATGTGVMGVASMFVASIFGGQAAYSPPAPTIAAPTFFNLPIIGSTEVLTSSFIRAAISRGVDVSTYDVDDAVVYQKLKDRGLQGGVITDRIDVILASMGRLPMKNVSTLINIKRVGTSCGCSRMNGFGGEVRMHAEIGCRTILNFTDTNHREKSWSWRTELVEYTGNSETELIVNRTLVDVRCVNDTQPWSDVPPAHVLDEESL